MRWISGSTLPRSTLSRSMSAVLLSIDACMSFCRESSSATACVSALAIALDDHAVVVLSCLETISDVGPARITPAQEPYPFQRIEARGVQRETRWSARCCMRRRCRWPLASGDSVQIGSRSRRHNRRSGLGPRQDGRRATALRGYGRPNAGGMSVRRIRRWFREFMVVVAHSHSRELVGAVLIHRHIGCEA
jgi:hypothetical protein